MENWLSGRKHCPAKTAYIKSVSLVQIQYSPLKNLGIMNQKIYEHDTEISPVIRYCQPCMSINLLKFVKKWENTLDNNVKMIL